MTSAQTSRTLSCPELYLAAYLCPASKGGGLKNGRNLHTHTHTHTHINPPYRNNTHYEYLSSALLLALAACSGGGGSNNSSKTSTGQVIVAGRPDETVNMPAPDKTPTKTDTKTENKDPPDEPVIATTRPQITLVSGDDITAPALTEGGLVASGAEIFNPTLTADDLNFTYEVLDTGDGPLFQMVEETGSLSFKTDTIPDFETRQKGYLLSYRASSDDLVFTQQIHIPIRDMDEAPSGMRIVAARRAVPEDNKIAVKLADIAFEDEDKKPAFQANTASISDNRFFEIRNGDELWLKPDAPLDYETARRHQIIIQSDNSAHQKRFVLSVENVVEMPVIEQFVLDRSQGAVFEGKSSAMHLSTAFFIGKDGLRIDDDKIAIEIQDSPLFEIRNNTQLWLKDKVELDFENVLDRVHNITVWVSGAPHLSKDFTLVLSDIDEKPSAIVISPVRARVDEGLTAPIKLAEISFRDDALGDNSVLLSDADLFFLEPAAEKNIFDLWLAGGRQLDFETRPLHFLTLSFDGTGRGTAPPDRIFWLEVADTDDAATRLSFQYFIREVGEGRSQAGRLADILFEDEDSKTAFLHNAAYIQDNPLFEIKNQNQIWLKAGAELDFEAQASHKIMVFYKDNPLVKSEFTLMVGDRDDAPTGLQLIAGSLNPDLLRSGEGQTLFIEEGVSQETELFKLAIEDDALGTNIVTMNPRLAPFFEVRPTDSRLIKSVWLKSGQMLDYEQFSSIDLTLWLANNLSATSRIALVIENRDEPEFFSPWPERPVEGEALGLPVLNDPDGALRIQAARWFGSANGIDGWQILTVWQRDLSYVPTLGDVGRFLRAEVAYIDALNVAKEIFTPASLVVKNTNNRPPVFTSDSVALLSEAILYRPTDSLYQATIRADVAGSEVTFTLSGADAGRMRIDPHSGRIFFLSATQPDADGRKTRYDVVVGARTSLEGQVQEASLAVRFDVEDVNDIAPDITSADTAIPLNENRLLNRGHFIYQASATFDTEPIIWSLAGADRALFSIDRDSGIVTVKNFIQPDYERNADGYQIEIIARSGTVQDRLSVTIPITDIDEYPGQLIVQTLTGRLTENMDTSRPIKIATIHLEDDGLGSNYLFLTGEKKDKFELRADGLYLATGAEIDFEERGGSQLRVTVDINASGQRLAEFALPQSIALRVINIDEPGQFAAWTGYPVIGGTLIAPLLSDPDGRITNLTYQWQSQILGQEWQDILHAETVEYTPRPEDLHKFLRVIAFYDDREGAGKSAISDITDSVKEVATTARNTPSRSVETPLYNEDIYGEEINGEEINGWEQMVDIL